jgi:hypothetical protein
MMSITPSRMMCFPPIAIMPMMMFVPIAVQRPLRVMSPDPIRMMFEPPAAGMPLVILVVIAPAMMMLVGLHQSRHSREESCYHNTGYKYSQFHALPHKVNVRTIWLRSLTEGFEHCLLVPSAIFAPARFLIIVSPQHLLDAAKGEPGREGPE